MYSSHDLCKGWPCTASPPCRHTERRLCNGTQTRTPTTGRWVGALGLTWTGGIGCDLTHQMTSTGPVHFKRLRVDDTIPMEAACMDHLSGSDRLVQSILKPMSNLLTGEHTAVPSTWTDTSWPHVQTHHVLLLNSTCVPAFASSRTPVEEFDNTTHLGWKPHDRNAIQYNCTYY